MQVPPEETQHTVGCLNDVADVVASLQVVRKEDVQVWGL